MKDANCIFCKIIDGAIPSTKVYEDDYVFAMRDINPQAPVHILVLPKEHICCADAIDESNSVYVARIFEAIAKIAKAEGLDNGYRVINNCGEDGGQTVMHLHYHILGGIKLSEKII
ncbi:MAG: histidine triad nucleotide-binding protein [Oscillospiraceae bacterium]|nr:histidine triad nucleotide-binding protein [Oscillospiraceae bacterium]